MKPKFIWQDWANCRNCGYLGKSLMLFSSGVWWCPSCAFLNGVITKEELSKLTKRIRLSEEDTF